MGRIRAWLSDPPRWATRTGRALDRVEIGLGAVFVVLIFVLVLTQALQRYLPFEGWSSTGEMSVFALVWLTFVVSGVLVTRDGHIAIEMADSLRSERLRRLVRVVSCLIVAAIGVALVAEAWSLTMSQGLLKSPSMRLPMSWFYAITLVGFVSTVIRSLFAAVKYAVVGVPPPDYGDLGELPA
jgi:TRAP-type transport system small permease protein